MTLLTALSLTNNAGGARFGIRRGNHSPRLVDVLCNGQSARAFLRPTAAKERMLRIQAAVQDLFADTRRQQMQSLDTTYADDATQGVEQTRKRDLTIAVAGFGLASAGALVAPFFYLPSIALCTYAFREVFAQPYRLLVEERKLDYRAVLAFSVAAAFAGGYVVAASFGGVLGLLNFYLVAKTEDRSKRSIVDLFGGQVRSVWLLVDGVEVETPIGAVCAGDTVVVHAGQMIPVDGVITSGTATIDQHMLTGESQPVEKEAGDSVLASTVLLSGFIHLRVEQAGDMTVAAQITHMLSQTTDFKRTLESRTDRFLNQITLPILGLSVLALPLAGVGGAVAVLWYYPGIRMMWFGPMSMLSYLQIAAQQRILVKDGRALETLARIDTVVFDKTGTLTMQEPTVSRIHCYNGIAESDLLRYVAAAEAKQSHPIARAILQTACDRGLELPRLEDAHYKVGYGLKVQIEGRAVRVGSVRFMQMEAILVPPAVMAHQLESHAQGHSLVLVAVDDELAGAIELKPTIRPEAQQIVEMLHQRGISTVIISGDNTAPTQRLAAELGIDRTFAEVLPEEKANLVTQLQQEGRKVCFVGDGINDSIALKTADVAVSLRGATTIATDMAEIVFMDGTLRQLPDLFALADDFAANMRTNVWAAVLPGAIGIAGTLLFGWGMTVCVLLTQGSTPVGLYNSIKPLLANGSERPTRADAE